MLVGGIGGRGGIKMASASKSSANEPWQRTSFLVHVVQLKLMIKAHFSGRMVSSGISDVAITSVHSEKTHLKKLIMINKISIIKLLRYSVCVQRCWINFLLNFPGLDKCLTVSTP